MAHVGWLQRQQTPGVRIVTVLQLAFPVWAVVEAAQGRTGNALVLLVTFAVLQVPRMLRLPDLRDDPAVLTVPFHCCQGTAASREDTRAPSRDDCRDGPIDESAGRSFDPGVRARGPRGCE